MLFLQFYAKHDRYVIEARRVLVVIPLLKISRIPKAPNCINGAVDYRGHNIPVLDLNWLLCGKNSRNRISTRIMLVDFVLYSSQHKTLGLMAEKVTEVLKIEDNRFSYSGNKNQSVAPYLGPVTSDAQGTLQQIIIDNLVDMRDQDLIFQ